MINATKNLLLITITVTAFLVSGCLADTRSGRMDTSDTGDTADTSDTQDSSDTSDLCDGVQCDEVCGEFCDPATGQCVASFTTADQAQPEPECVNDADCADTDPCTDHICVHPLEECGGGTSYCQQLDTLPICNRCAGVTCDDGDPCTTDYCDPDSGQCFAERIQGCSANRCSGQNLTTIRAVADGQYYAVDLTIAGTVGPSAYGACDDGPDNDCTYDVVARGDGAAAPVFTNNNTWFCSTTGIDFVSQGCTPVHDGGAYWIWGTGAYRGTGPEPADADKGPGAQIDVPPSDSLRVEDFCLQTNARGLVGTYQVSVSAWGQSQDFMAEVSTAPDGSLRWNADVDDCHCPEGSNCLCDLVVAHASRVTTGDGDVTLSLRGTFNATNEPFDLEIELFSRQNTLQGVAYPWGGGGGGGGAPSGAAVAPLEVMVTATKLP